MILVGQYDSPFVRRIAVALHWYGVKFERNTMSVFGDAERMREINPLGRIPSLILDGGETLIDSWAIQDWLDESAPVERRLTPPAGAERRNVLRLTALAAGAVDKAGAMVYEKTIRPPEKRYAPWLERCQLQLATALDALETACGDGWLAGPRLSQADVMLGAMTWYVSARAPEAKIAARCPRIMRHYNRVLMLPEFQMTAPAGDEAMPAQL
jgi:glutathione S-transferase